MRPPVVKERSGPVGGRMLIQALPGEITLTRVTITGNNGGEFGGGIAVWGWPTRVTTSGSLITRNSADVLHPEVERLTGELSELTGEAETAKRNLVAFQQEIARLREEKVRMIARLANAQARLRLQETLNGLSTDADIRALEGVRDHINQLVAEVQVARDTSDTDLERRLGKIREAEADAAARAQLDELKRARKRKLLPLILPMPAAAHS